MGKRHQARELALKVLFQLESSEDDPEEVLRYHAAEGAATSDVAHFAGDLVRGVMANQAKLDAAEALAQLAEQAGLSLVDLALAFVIRHPAVTAAIIGMPQLMA